MKYLVLKEVPKNNEGHSQKKKTKLDTDSVINETVEKDIKGSVTDSGSISTEASEIRKPSSGGSGVRRSPRIAAIVEKD